MNTAVMVNGFFVGLIYGLLAVGLVVVYRGARVINFAHGEIAMCGAFVFTEMHVTNGIRIATALPVAIALCTVIGGATELVVVRPLRNEPRLMVMIGTYGVGALLVIWATRRYGTDPRFVPSMITGAGIEIGDIRIRPAQLLILGICILILCGLWIMYRYTSFGLRLRAVAIDPFAAGLVGVDIGRTSLVTWALAGGLAGLTGILVSPLITFGVGVMTPLMLRALAAALVGGLTSIWAAFLAGVALGIFESMIAFEFPIAGVVELVLAGFIIALLLLRPSGLVRSAY